MVLAGIGCFFFYPRHRPQYCWLVFGPDAKARLVVRLDGAAISIERCDEGQSVQNVARFDRLEDCKDVPIPAMDGHTVYVLAEITDIPVVPAERLLAFDVRVSGSSYDFKQGVMVWMGFDKGKAAVAHFHGPLTVSSVDKKFETQVVPRVRWEVPGNLVLHRGNKPSELFVTIGTTNDENSCRVTVCTHDHETNQPLFPNDVHPFADVEFPAKEPNRPPIRKRYALAAVC